ncbi:MAG: hypothetical protein ABSA72_08480 [Nitrososphaerales archaeon]
MAIRKWNLIAPVVIVFLVLLCAAPVQQARAQTPTVITAPSATIAVNIGGAYSASEWTDTQMITIPNVAITVGFKYNSTGLLFVMQWANGGLMCSNSSCFGGIELGFLNNTAEMGSALTPTIMILASPSFKGSYDEFISAGATTPSTVESHNYKTQSTCSLALSGSTYTAQCYRPFKLNGASPYDPFPSLVAGSQIEIGFAVGNFAIPGQHAATSMASYVLVLGPAASTSSTTTSSTSATGSSGSTTGTQSSASTTTTSSTTTTTTSQTSTTSTQTTPSGPSVSNYWEELAIVVIGFSVFLLIVMMRYQRS